MASSSMDVSLVIKAVDAATAPIKQVTQSVATMNDKIRAVGDAAMSVRKITNSFDALDKKIKQTGRSASLFSGLRGLGANISSAVSGAAQDLDRMALRGIALGYGFKSLFLDPALDAERLGFLMRKLADGDMKKMASWTEKLNKLNEQSPFGIQELTQAFATLKISGLDPANGELQGLADALTAVGRTKGYELESAAIQIGQAFAKNNLLVDDMKPLLNQQVDIMGALARSMGKSRTEVEKMNFAGKGQLAIQAALLQLAHENAGAAQEYSKTVSGMMNRTGDMWRKFVVQVARSGFFDSVSMGLERALRRIEKSIASGSFQKVAEDFAKNFILIFESLAVILPVIAGAITRIASWISFLTDKIENLQGILFAIGAIKAAEPAIRAATTAGGPLAGAAVAAAAGTAGYIFGSRDTGNDLLFDMSRNLAPAKAPQAGLGPLANPTKMDVFLARDREARMQANIEMKVVLDEKNRLQAESIKQRGNAKIRTNVGHAGGLK